jgi:hypothetical protein
MSTTPGYVTTAVLGLMIGMLAGWMLLRMLM